MTSYSRTRNNLLSLPLDLKLSGSGSGVEADAETVISDCPADEGQGVLRPGSASLSRQSENKPHDDPDEPPVKADRTRPIYKGVTL